MCRRFPSRTPSRVCQHEGRSEEFGLVRMGNDRLDSRRVAIHFHSRGLGQGFTPPTGRIHQRLGACWLEDLTGDALKSATKWTFVVAGIASLLLAAFSLLLPHTPPRKRPKARETCRLASEIIGSILRVLVLWLVTSGILSSTTRYFNWTGSLLGAAVKGRGVGILATDHADDERRPDRRNPTVSSSSARRSRNSAGAPR